MKKTSKNLMIAFIKESQISVRYELFAKVAKKENFFFISRIFEDFANQEKEHAKWNYIMLQQVKKDEPIENLTIEIQNPTTYGATLQNLRSAINEEENGWQEVYPNFANTANMEGYHNIANRLKQIGNTKKNHFLRLKMLLSLVQDERGFSNNKIIFWKCMECGYEIAVDEIPNDYSCPSCGHLRQYFKRQVLKVENIEKELEKKSSWVCMECGYQVELDELPENWACLSCGRSKAYFKRKPIAMDHYKILAKEREKVIWTCLQCGNEEEIELPDDWTCSSCGYPKSVNSKE